MSEGMENCDNGIEINPPSDRAGSSLLIRLFGVFAILFGLPYLIQGVSALRVFSARFGLFLFHYQLVVIILDVLIGMASIVIGVGLAFRKEWARKAWLAFLIVTLLIHFFMTVLQILIGSSNMGWLFRWISIIVFITLLSFLFLSMKSTKARFR